MCWISAANYTPIFSCCAGRYSVYDWDKLELLLVPVGELGFCSSWCNRIGQWREETIERESAEILKMVQMTSLSERTSNGFTKVVCGTVVLTLIDLFCSYRLGIRYRHSDIPYCNDTVFVCFVHMTSFASLSILGNIVLLCSALLKSLLGELFLVWIEGLKTEALSSVKLFEANVWLVLRPYIILKHDILICIFLIPYYNQKSSWLGFSRTQLNWHSWPPWR